jgi:hypothetical protein
MMDGGGMMDRPEDFSFRYEWREGSVPPPYYYEITISVSPRGEGIIVFCPDYTSRSAPAWQEHFRVPSSLLNELYQLMLERGVFGGHWETYPEEHAPEGGPLEWLEVVVRGERHKMPWLLLHPEAVRPIYEFIRTLVPETIWARLRKQHEDFIATYRNE